MLNSDTNKCCDMGTTKYLDKHQNKHEIESIHKYNEYILPLPQVQPYAGATRLHATFTPPPSPYPAPRSRNGASAPPPQPAARGPNAASFSMYTARVGLAAGRAEATQVEHVRARRARVVDVCLAHRRYRMQKRYASPSPGVEPDPHEAAPPGVAM